MPRLETIQLLYPLVFTTFVGIKLKANSKPKIKLHTLHARYEANLSYTIQWYDNKELPEFALLPSYGSMAHFVVVPH